MNAIYGFYIQDTWKVTRKLTMNYGLRYDYEAGAFRGGTNPGPNGTCFQGDGIISACSSDKNNFQPRLGFTYNPWQHWLLKASLAETTILAFNNVVLDSLKLRWRHIDDSDDRQLYPCWPGRPRGFPQCAQPCVVGTVCTRRNVIRARSAYFRPSEKSGNAQR
jgi:hypothetical protein